MRSYPKMASLQASESIRIASATTARQTVRVRMLETQSACFFQRTLADCGCLSHVLLKDERDRRKHTRIIVWHDLQRKVTHQVRYILQWGHRVAVDDAYTVD